MIGRLRPAVVPGVHTFSTRQSSPMGSAGHITSNIFGTWPKKSEFRCGARNPSSTQSRTPVHGCRFAGGMKRFAPAVDAAYGTPRNACTPPCALRALCPALSRRSPRRGFRVLAQRARQLATHETSCSQCPEANSRTDECSPVHDCAPSYRDQNSQRHSTPKRPRVYPFRPASVRGKLPTEVEQSPRGWY